MRSFPWTPLFCLAMYILSLPKGILTEPRPPRSESPRSESPRPQTPQLTPEEECENCLSGAIRKATGQTGKSALHIAYNSCYRRAPDAVERIRKPCEDMERNTLIFLAERIVVENCIIHFNDNQPPPQNPQDPQGVLPGPLPGPLILRVRPWNPNHHGGDPPGPMPFGHHYPLPPNHHGGVLPGFLPGPPQNPGPVFPIPYNYHPTPPPPPRDPTPFYRTPTPRYDGSHRPLPPE